MEGTTRSWTHRPVSSSRVARYWLCRAILHRTAYVSPALHPHLLLRIDHQIGTGMWWQCSVPHPMITAISTLIKGNGPCAGKLIILSQILFSTMSIRWGVHVLNPLNRKKGFLTKTTEESPSALAFSLLSLGATKRSPWPKANGII
jgi:hypothetical protein